VRLRQELGLAELSPAHRLDRLTAGVLVFTTRRELRGAYQTLFALGQVGICRRPIPADAEQPAPSRRC
jgi:tRNA pseudouridine32 synthase/23S rRNA pseudouridine746 synthase